jgi:1-deoxy-D-xylulose-5-phosphate synthase
VYPLLDLIRDPADLRALDRASLPQLAAELRAFVLQSVARTGGHLASSLGAIELTVAVHYVFDTPRDRIVWDVGHQAYAHKVLTGRREAMDRLRMPGGPSGFPRRSESEYDTFGTAHSSTSISAALGMAVAERHVGGSRKVIAVIGDGGLSAGMSFEALNNAGVAGADLLVILNDNEMSISESVGALDRHLARLRRSATAPQEAAAPSASQWFEALGFHCTGPIDGHDVHGLVAALRSVDERRGPRLLHVVTRKGKGYARAEADPILYHGVTRFDPDAGIAAQGNAKPTYTQVFGDWACDMARRDGRFVCVTPAMREGSGLVRFAKEHASRYFDVGIAEQHAVTFAAGLACEGLRPVVAIYSTFLQRAYDQLVHDVAIQNLPVAFAIDRAGVVGPDGATHAGAFDLSYLRCVPNMTVMAPADEDECRQMLYTACTIDGPAAVRYPRGAGPGVAVADTMRALAIGRGEVRRRCRRRTSRVAILAFGSVLQAALAAGDLVDATVVNMRFVKPIDGDLVLQMASEHGALVTVEENVIAGGAGSAVAEYLVAAGITLPLLHLGLPDRFPEHGERAAILAECGLDAPGIASAIRQRFGTPVLRPVATPAA